MEWGGMEWSGSGQGPVEGSCEHGGKTKAIGENPPNSITNPMWPGMESRPLR
jgi:hypothetical protein